MATDNGTPLLRSISSPASDAGKEEEKKKTNTMVSAHGVHPVKPGRSICERCFQYGKWYKQKMREKTMNAQKPDQAMREVDQESSEEEEPRPQEVQDGDGQEHIETDPGDSNLADEIASGFGTDRMAIDFLVD
ncbi:hypothetical protein PG988_012932 [Apiospora saccharicola]